jgi:sigma-B regulation protein RsbU (phosphoserine phosphatase)
MKDSPVLLQVGHSAECANHLRNSGFQVTHAATLAEGIAAFQSHQFNVVLLDLELPDNLEPEAFQKFSKVAGKIPIVALTSQWQVASPAEVISLGAQDCLTKEHLSVPLLAQALRNAVVRHEFHRAFNDDRTLLRALMQHIPDAIYFKDAASRFLMISDAHAKIFHLANPADAVGKTDHDFFSGPHADQALHDEQEIIRTGQPLVGIEEMETWPDGHETWVSTTKMPLCDSAGKIIGTFGISRDITERKRMQDALARRTRELEQKNQQIAEELRMARELQMAMLPQEFPSFLGGDGSAGENALEFFSFYHPTGAVSGDFFNVNALSDSKVGVFICDVMGHDVRAALVTAMMRAQVQDLSAAAPDPGQLLTQMNQNLFGIFKQTGATMYATAFYLVADVARGEIFYASAAHPEPLQVRRNAGAVERLGGNGAPGRVKGPALGLFADAQFPTHRRKLEAGDLIALYTDGLIEINSSDQQQIFSSELLTEAVRRRAQLPATDLLNGVISEIHEFSGQPEFDDDVCLIGMEVKRLG